ncbi:MAG TPA: YbaK/EbsC family protein, partial [Actinoplanes sp.]|nr:YbaK/EbsC family protein [Actinoplanes sp.]
MHSHPNVIAVRDALRSRDYDAEIVILDEAVHTAALAAAALGVEVGQIANSLVFDAGGEPLLVLTSGAHRVDTKRLGNIRRASPEFVRLHTGQPIGGVAPLGHPKPVRTLVDVDLERFPVVWAAAGVPQSVFPISFAEL